MCSDALVRAWVCTLALAPLLGAAGAHADDAGVRLEARPATCVALHRGQVCYKRISVSWQPLPNGRHCLLSDKRSSALVCWHGDARRRFEHDYADDSSERLRLERIGADGRTLAVLAEVTLSTAWVYRDSRGAGGWRLF